MRSKVLLLAALVATCSAFSATAQETVLEEVVVTGARLEEFNPAQTPLVILSKRADNLITTLTVTCDTRDEAQRLSELKATLRNLIKAAAADQKIELGLGDEIIGKFDDSMLDAVISRSSKADTSVARVIIKTPITPEDTFDGATSRVERFVKSTPVVGRSEILSEQAWELTIVGPNRYHAQIVKLIADSARTTASAFGADYGVSVIGLQLPVSWYQSGPLDLGLYIPYTMTVVPKP